MTRLAWSPVDGARFATKTWGVLPRSRSRTQWSGLGGAAAFTPTSIAGLQGWWKADAGTSTTTDGVAISSWADQSGNSRTASQGTGANQPLYKAAIQNALPVVRFDGVSDFLQTGAFVLVQPGTVFVVGRASSTPGNETFTDGITVQTFRAYAKTASASIWSGTLEISAATTWAAFHEVTAIFNGASSQVAVDGGTAVTGNPGPNTSAGGFTIGARGDAGEPGHVDVGEVLVYDSALSAGNRTSVEGYLRTRWGTP